MGKSSKHVSVANAKLLWGAKSNILPHLPWWLKNIFITYTSSLTNLESIIWNWGHLNAAFSENKSSIWHIESQRMGCDPVTWTWKQLQNACHLKLTWRCMSLLVWWATTGGSSKGSHTLHNHSANILLGKGPAGNQSRCHLQKMPWRLSMCWNRCVCDSSHFGFCWLH